MFLSYLKDFREHPSFLLRHDILISHLLWMNTLLKYTYTALASTRLRHAACEACRVESVKIQDTVRIVLGVLSARRQVVDCFIFGR